MRDQILVSKFWSIIGRALPLLALAWLGPVTHAQVGPAALNLSGSLFDSSNNAITQNSVNFKLEIYDKAAACVLYSELHPGQDLSQTSGGFSLVVGGGASAQNHVSGSSALSAALFTNSATTTPVAGCPSGVTFAEGDERLVRVYYDLGQGFVAMTPDIPVVSSAFAMVADTLQGKHAADFVQVDGTSSLSQANAEYAFSSSNWPKLKSLVDGTSTQYMTQSPSGPIDYNGQRLTDVGAPTAGTDVTTKNYADTMIAGQAVNVSSIGTASGDGQTLIWSTASDSWITGTPSGTDSTKLPLAGGTLTGALNLSGNDLVSVGNVTLNAQKSFALGTFTDAQESTLIATLASSNKGTSWYNSDHNVYKIWDGANAVPQAYLDNLTSKLLPAWIPTTSVVAGTYGSPNQVPSFTVGADGRLTAANQITISGVAPGGTASGDLTGSYPGPSIAPAAVTTAKLSDNAITSAKLNSSGIAVNQLLITDNVTGTTIGYATCGINQIMAWSAGGWACTTVASLSPVTSVAGKTGAVTLNAADIGGLGTASLKDYGTAAGNLVQLDSNGRVSASELPASTGTLTLLQTGLGLLGGPVTTTGTISVNAGNAAAQIVQENFSGQISQTAGSAGAPAYSFDGNSGSGMFSPSANYLSLSTNGTAALTIDAYGNIGVGTTAPLASFDFSGRGPQSAILVPRDTAGTRPAGINGMIRYNTSSNVMEAFTNGAWQSLAAGSGVGTVQNIATSIGLLGGPISMSGTLSVNVGTGATQIVQENGNAQIAQGNGNVAAPAYSFAGNTAAGLFSPSTNSVSLVTSGSTALNVSPAGQVGIGTISAGAILDIYGLGVQSAVTLPRDSSANRPVGTNGMVRYNTTTSAFEFFQANAWVAYNTGASNGTVTNVASGVGLMGGPVTSNGTLSVNVGTGAQQIVQLNASAQATLADGSPGSPTVSFVNSPSSGLFSPTVNSLSLSTSGSAALTINANGLVGIGSGTPQSALDVNAFGTAASALIVPRDVAANRPPGVNGMIRYTSDAGRFEAFQAGSWQPLIGTPSNAGFVNGGNLFGANATLGTNDAYSLSLLSGGSAAVTIVPAGFIGVGTSAPAYRQHVTEYRSETTGSVLGTSWVEQDVAPTSASNGYFYATTNQSRFKGGVNSPSATLMGITGQGLNDSSFAIGVANGVYAQAANTSTGTITNARGISASAGNAGTSAGTVTNAYAGQFAVSNTSGTVTNGYGVYTGTIAATNKWSIYASDATAPTYLAGRVGIGTSSPTALLDLYGTGANSAMILPRDTTANRPTGVNGMIRYNSTLAALESFANGTWQLISAGTSVGTVQSVATDSTLIGGPITNSGTLRVNVGNAATQIVQENASAQIAQGAGSVGAPAYSFAGSLASGLYSPGTNSISLVTSGTSALNVSAAGLIGVGTVSAGAILDVYGSGPQSAVTVPRDSAANRPVGTNGMVRYNTTTSAFEFFQANAWVNYNTGSTTGTVTNIASGSGLLGGPIASSGTLSVNLGTGAGQIPQLNSNAQTALTAGSPAAPTYSFLNSTGAGLLSPAVNQIALATSGTTALTIQPNGFVGINTSSPQSGFDIAIYGSAGSAVIVPRDTTANRPAWGVNGMLRYNTSSGMLEGFLNGGWANIPAGSGVGTVQSVRGGVGLLGGAITINGTLDVNVGSAAGQIVQENASAQIAQANGSVSAPAYSFAGNLASGLYSPGTNSLSLVTSGTSALTVGATGQVGIGTVSAGSILDIYGLGAQSAITLPRDSTSNRPVGANGMVRYNSTTASFEFFQNNTWVNYNTGAANGTVTSLASGSGLLGGPITANGTLSVNIGTGVGQIPQLNANAQTALNAGTAAAPTYSFFNSVGAGLFSPAVNQIALATSGTTALTITANGSVGINTAAPQSGFDIATLGTAGSALIVPRDTASNRPGGVNGMIRYNTTSNALENFANGSWQTISSGSSAGTLQSITTSTGLLGGTITANGTIAVNAGTAAGQVVLEQANGQILQAPGSAGAPSHSFYDNPNSGLFSPGSGQLGFSANGSTALTISTNGNLTAAGTFTAPIVYNTNSSTNVYASTSASAIVPYSGSDPVVRIFNNSGASGSAGYLAFQTLNGATNQLAYLGAVTHASAYAPDIVFGSRSGSTAYNENMRLASGGNLGLGTSAPAALADFYGTGAQSSILLPRDSMVNRPTGVNGMIRYNTTAGALENFANGSWQLIASGTGVGTVQNISTDSTLLGGPISTSGTLGVNVGTGSLQIVQENTSGQILQSGGTSASPAYSFAGTGNSGTGLYSTGTGSLGIAASGTTAMFVTSAGNIGVGYGAPTSRFVVNVNLGTSPASYDAGEITAFRNGSQSSDTREVTLGTSLDGQGYLRTIRNMYLVAGASQRMALTSAGVGIGTTAPSSQLSFGSSVSSGKPGYYATGSPGGAARNDVVSVYESGENRYGLGIHSGTLEIYSPGTAGTQVQIGTRSNDGNGNFVPTMVFSPSNNIGVGTVAPAALTDFYGTGAQSSVLLPRDSTANRPTGVNGMIRYNTSSAAFEGYANSSWQTIASGTTAGTLQSINTSTGLLGGTITTNGTIAVNAGTGAGQVVLQQTSGQILQASGSAAAPTHSFVGSTGTGMYSPGTNLLSFSTAGTAAINILANGNIGVGTASPTKAFSIVGSAPSILIQDAADTGDQNATWYLQSSYSTGPIASDFRIINAGAGFGTGGVIADFQKDASNNARVGIAGIALASAVVNIGANLNTAASDGLVVTTTNSASGSYAPIKAIASNLSSNTQRLYSGVGTSTETFYVMSNGQAYFAGNVGIGTSAPQAILDVYATGAQSSMVLPRDSTANRPTGVNGMIRYNITSNSLENFANGYWQTISSGSSAGTLQSITTSTGLLGGTITTNGTIAVNAGTAAGQVVLQQTGGQILQASGSAAAPTHSFSGSTGTGMYSPAVNQLAFSTAGTAALTITPTGNMGLGTTLPSFALDVAGTINSQTSILVSRNNVGANINGAMVSISNAGTGDAITTWLAGGLRWYNGIDQSDSSKWKLAVTNGTPNFATDTKLTITSAGNVGIGTSIPGALTDFFGTGSQSAILLPRDTTANRPTGINGMIRYNTSLSQLETFTNGSWSGITTAATSSSSYLALSGGTMSGAIVHTNGSVNAPSMGFQDTTTGFYSTGAGNISAATAGTARLTISSSGNIGIGTTSPLNLLANSAYVTSDAAGTSTNANGVNWVVSGAGYSQSLNNVSTLTTANGLDIAIGGTAASNRILNLSTSALDVFTVTGGGRVGIGSTNPNRNLVIAGVAPSIGIYDTSGNNLQFNPPQASSGSYGQIDVTGANALRFNTNSSEWMRITSTGNAGIGTASPQSILDVYATGAQSAVVLPRDTTVNRPTGVNGMLRYNTNLNALENFANGAWQTVSSGSTAGSLQSITTSTGLIGGTITTNGTISVNAGTAANLIVQENAAAQIAQNAGTFALPAFAFVNSPSTGLFSPGANSLAFTTAGTTALTVTNSGSVGIGTTSPPGKLVVVSDTPYSSGGGVRLQSDASTSSFNMYLNSSSAGYASIQGYQNGVGAAPLLLQGLGGSIGIGTANPSSAVDIVSGGSRTTDTEVKIGASALHSTMVPGYSGLLMASNADGNGNQTVGSLSSWFLDLGGRDVLNSTSDQDALVVRRSPAGSNIASSTMFFKISAAGNVGIGTSTPAALTDFYGTAAQSSILIPRDTTANRPTGVNGMIRYNTNSTALEAFANGSWQTISSGSTAGTLQSITTSTGLIGGTITTNGTIAVNAGTNAGQVVLEQTNGQILQSPGSAAAPTHSFVSSTGSGMYSPGTNLLSFSTAGTAALNILANGNTGLGTTNPTAKFEVVGSSNALPATSGTTQSGGLISRFHDSSYLILDVGGFGSSGIWMQATNYINLATNYSLMLNPNGGNVGIGTTASLAVLDVYGTGASSAIRVPQDTTANRPTGANGMIRYNTNLASLENFSNGAWQTISSGSSAGTLQSITTSTGLLGGTITTNGTIAVNAGTAAGQVVLEQTNGQILQASGSATAPTHSFVGSTGTGMYSPGTNLLSFSTAGTASVNILANGYLGIGTTAPVNPLDVYGDGIKIASRASTPTGATSVGAQAYDFYSSPSYMSTYLAQNGSSSTGVTAGISNANLGVLDFQNTNAGLILTNGQSPLVFATLSLERMRILGSNGSVGIGTTAPQSILDVYGSGAQSAIVVPRDSTTNRPTGVNGMLRYNTNLAALESFSNGSWQTIPSGSSAGTLQSITTSTGLLGGTITTNGTIAVNAGTGAGQVVLEQSGGQILQAPGSAAAPTHSFVGSTGTGMYSPGTNLLSFSTAGTSALNITASGNVGLGTTSPAYPLDVAVPTNGAMRVNSATGSANLILAQGGSSNGSLTASGGGGTDITLSASRGLHLVGGTGSGENPIDFTANSILSMSVTTAGNVGIGTTGPLYQTHIFGAGQSTSNLSDSGANGGFLYIQDSGGIAGNGGAVIFGAAQGKFAAIKSFITNGGSNVIGDLTFSTRNSISDTALTERMRITSAGRVGIGTSNPTSLMHLYGAGTYSSGFKSQYSGSGGTDWAMGMGTDNAFYFGYGTSSNEANTAQISTSGVYAQLSDGRLKTDVSPIGDALQKVLKLRGVSYRWIAEKIRGDQTELGVIAQEVEQILPEIVATDREGRKQVRYSMLIPVLINALKEAYQNLTAVENRVSCLEATNRIFEDQNLQLMSDIKKLNMDNLELKNALCEINPNARICANSQRLKNLAK